MLDVFAGFLPVFDSENLKSHFEDYISKKKH